MHRGGVYSVTLTICAISDTHNNHDKLVLPESDILLHAGDFSGLGTLRETKAFMEWFSNQKAKHKIFISGNHDFLDQNDPGLFKILLEEYPNIKYLRDEMVTVEGIKIWGRPWTPEFNGWAFMADPQSPKMLSSLSIVPTGVDILLTHGPAFEILDMMNQGNKVGCQDLLNELERIQPRYMVFGHIHHSSGVRTVGNTTHINAAVLNDDYKLSFKPRMFAI